MNRKTAVTLVLLGVVGPVLAACSHRPDDSAHAARYGSLKDDPPRQMTATGKRAKVAASMARPDNQSKAHDSPRVLPPLNEEHKRIKALASPHLRSAEPATPLAQTMVPSSEGPASVAPAAPQTPPAPAPAAPAPAAPAPAAPVASSAPAPSVQRPELTNPVPQPAPLAPVFDSTSVTKLLAEGQTLFEAGKVVEARRRFVAAMNGPIPDVLLALARSYDTYYLSRLPTSDGAPDMQRALVLYERAAERGAPAAAEDLERTRNILGVPR